MSFRRRSERETGRSKETQTAEVSVRYLIDDVPTAIRSLAFTRCLAMNTMYALIAARAREIGTLRALRISKVVSAFRAARMPITSDLRAAKHERQHERGAHRSVQVLR